MLVPIFFLIALIGYFIWYFSDGLQKISKQNEEIIKLLKQLK